MAWLAAGCGNDATSAGPDSDGDVAVDTGAVDVGDDDARKDAGALDTGGGEDAGGDAGDSVIGPGKPCSDLADCGEPTGPCRSWVCHATLGCVETLLPDEASCLPDDACYTLGSCKDAACVPVAEKDCDDGDGCTQDTCSGGVCGATPYTKADNVPCDDGDACTLADVCDGGTCTGGANQCLCASDDDCKDKNGGDLCKGVYFCAVQADGSRACQLDPATFVVCDGSANTACTQAACDAKTGKCGLVNLPDGTACSDGDKCSDGETCSSGVCKGGVAVCCQSDKDCAAKDDGDVCNGTYFCNQANGTCQFNLLTFVNCSSVDDSACTKNTCDAKTGACAMKPVKDGALCDDGNPCTPEVAKCKSGGCEVGTNTCQCNDDADCVGKDDGDLCNGTLYCSPVTGTCTVNPATVVYCPSVDDTACKKAQCVPKTGKCELVAVADGSTCDADGTVCTPNDVCQAGACISGKINTCTCATTEDCAQHDDGDLCNGSLYCDVQSATCKLNPATVVGCPSDQNTPCSKSLCQPATGKCALTFVNQGKVCEDGVPCTVGDLCENGSCKGGTDVCDCKVDGDCAAKEDGDVCNGTLFCAKTKVPWTCEVNPSTVIECPKVNNSFCQLAVCQSKSGKCELVVQHVDEPCDDGDACTVGTLCKGGFCINPDANADKPCDDGNPCTDDSCDKAFGCVNAANKAPCSDGNACTDGDACAGKVCVAGKDKVCDDSNPCTTDVCNKQAGCVVFNNADVCSDGDACTIGDGCKAGKCAAGKPKDCDDNAPCTLDGCDSKTGACTHDAKVAASVVCDDGIACTVDGCDPILGCQHTPSASACDDKIACTVDACAGKAGCVHTPSDDACDDASLCTLDTCVPGTGCAHAPQTDGVACFDNDPCTFGDSCKAGKCVSGPKAAECNVDVTQCKGKADGASCNDGDACTKGEACSAGVCAAPVKSVVVRTYLGNPKESKIRNGARVAARTTPVIALALAANGDVVFGTASYSSLRAVGVGAFARTVAGSGEDTSVDGKGTIATFKAIEGIVTNPDGSAIVTDTPSHRLRTVTASGEVTSLVGGASGYADGPFATAKFNAPAGLARASDGMLYVADKSNHCVRKVDEKAKEVSSFGGKCGGAGQTDGPYGTARFYFPTGIAASPQHFLVVADRSSHRIRGLDAKGVASTIAGSSAGFADGKGASAKFSSPAAVAVAPSGVIYVADENNHRVRRVGVDGVVTTIAGSTAGYADGHPAEVKFNRPYAITFDAFGDLVVGEVGNGVLRHIELRRFDCGDDKLCTLDTCDPQSGACKVSLANPCDDDEPCTKDLCAEDGAVCSTTAVVDGAPCDDGEVCTTSNTCGLGRCYASAKVERVSADAYGQLDGLDGVHTWHDPNGMAPTKAGDLLIADGSNHAIRRRDKAGVVTTLAGAPWLSGGFADGPRHVARFNFPRGVSERADGTIVVADASNHRVRALDAAGVVSTLAGGVPGFADGKALSARFKNPHAVVVDSDDNVVVVDTDNMRLRLIAGGQVTTFAGSASGWRDGKGADARFYFPTAGALMADGSIVVADKGNHVIRRVDKDGVVQTIAGRREATNDDGVLFEGAVNNPMAVAAGPHGEIFVGSEDGVIQMILPSGRMFTLMGNPKVKALVEGVGVEGSAYSVTGLAMGADGKLYFSDAYADRLGRLLLPVPECDDANACTLDVCQAGSGCKHIAMTTVCEDGDPCTSGDSCAAGACKPGAKVAGCTCKAAPGFGCDDGNPCTTEGCDAKAGCSHVVVADYTPCDDGVACTAGSRCDAGVCAPDPELWALSRLAGAPSKGGYASAVYGTTYGDNDGSVHLVGGKHAVGLMNRPSGVAIGADGTIYFTDRYNHAVRKITTKGVVTTIAGSPMSDGAGMRDGLGVEARFNSPMAVGVDSNDELFIVDRNNHAIRHVDVNGNVTTVAGAMPAAFGFKDGKGSEARLYNPRDLAIEGPGAAVIADGSNHRIRRLAADGAVTTIAGAGNYGQVDGPALSALFNDPSGIDVDGAGDVWIADRGNKAIRRLSGGIVETIVGANGSANYAQDGYGVTGGTFMEPFDVAVDDATGALIIVDYADHAVRRFTVAGGLRTIAGGKKQAASVPGVGAASRVFQPVAVAVRSDGVVFVVESDGQRIVELRQVGATCDDGNDCTLDACDKAKGCSNKVLPAKDVCPDGGPCQVAACDAKVGDCTYDPAPNGTLCGANGDCASQCDSGTCRVGGLVVAFAGSGKGGDSDGSAATARFNNPYDVEVDGKGGVLVSDRYNNRIRLIDAEGNVTTVAGNKSAGYAEGQGSQAQFNEPAGMDRGGDGNVYIADRKNHRVRRMSADYKVTTLAGSGKAGGQNGQASLAQFYDPLDVAVDGKGVVYVADANNHAVRAISTNGTVTTFAGKLGASGLLAGKGEQARFSYPSGLDFDGKGNLLLADGGRVIFRIAPDGHAILVAGAPGYTSAGNRDGDGLRAASFEHPISVLALADGSLLVGDDGAQTIRRLWPTERIVTVAGAYKVSKLVQGFGHEARLGAAMGMVALPDGSVLFADRLQQQIRRLRLDLGACAGMAGASKATAASSCAAVQANAKYSGLDHAWIDPDGGSKDDAYDTVCDLQTAGGGWTGIDPSWDAADVDAVLAGKGQAMRKCAVDGSEHVVSPVTDKMWSWLSKTPVAGSWLVNGKNVSCGADASFDALPCGAGFGCANKPGEGSVAMLPGMSAPNGCATPNHAYTSGAMSICGKSDYGNYQIYVRAK